MLSRTSLITQFWLTLSFKYALNEHHMHSTNDFIDSNIWNIKKIKTFLWDFMWNPVLIESQVQCLRVTIVSSRVVSFTANPLEIRCENKKIENEIKIIIRIQCFLKTQCKRFASVFVCLHRSIRGTAIRPTALHNWLSIQSIFHWFTNKKHFFAIVFIRAIDTKSLLWSCSQSHPTLLTQSNSPVSCLDVKTCCNM
jgi:hypothetical protein